MNRIREILHNYLFYISTRIKLPWGGGGGSSSNTLDLFIVLYTLYFYRRHFALHELWFKFNPIGLMKFRVKREIRILTDFNENQTMQWNETYIAQKSTA